MGNLRSDDVGWMLMSCLRIGKMVFFMLWFLESLMGKEWASHDHVLQTTGFIPVFGL